MLEYAAAISLIFVKDLGNKGGLCVICQDSKHKSSNEKN